ncbi:beta-N-acetylhexosaminidase [Leifsonia sp. F6_8S_P_1B]|uniref:beta-N-acetylhexosaminidase n=1 Tax=Leifsonia williamsii TaxID=3035919 RepID=A0ABT8K8D2_9MICO|nr:beta-N-acetylhexosaminidase [Leifsonia williamsii]MDN4613713.1 beta-N-acetylhexosaminidase [Leifsonia williamsii]
MTAADLLLPRPAEVRDAAGEFVLRAGARLRADAGGAPVLAWLSARLRAASGLALDGSEPEAPGVELAVDPVLADEEYRLSVAPGGVRITGGATAGVAHGAQTLLQLLPPVVYRSAPVASTRWAAPACEVADRPAYRWRGALLDVARHFLPLREVLRFVDLLAAHRLNVLQLHLTDDQGWRFPVDRYPLLTEVGGWRRESQVGFGRDAPGDGRPHGGFYSKDDLRELVAYAAARGVTVVPEIEGPGHAQAAIAAYPALGVGDRRLEVGTRWGIIPNVVNLEESTVAFYCDVLDEVLDIFPSAYIGIGGDECVKDQWIADPRTQERLRELGAATPEEGQSWFVRRLDAHLASRGRRSYGWDEILEGGLAPGATVASWRGESGAVAAARAGHDVVLCPDSTLYLNYRQSDSPDEPIPLIVPITVRDVYKYDPVPAGLTEQERGHVLGAQGNLWTEYIDSPRTLDYFAFPRLCALAEALWTAGERDADAFAERLDRHLARLDALGVEYRPADGPRPWQTRPGIPGRPVTAEERAAEVAALTASLR